MITQVQIEAACAAYEDSHGEPFVDRIRAALEDAEAAAWQPIETVPSDNTQILVLNGKTNRMAHTTGCASDLVSRKADGFTHWRHAPETPK